MFEDTFRTNFPEFASTERFPSTQITYWGNVSEKVISEKIFGDLTDHARSLFVAHNLTLQAQNVSTSSAGGMPGFNGGITASKSVGSASISYDTGSSAEEGGGSYNLTIYGKQLYRLMKTFGAGCIQI